MVSKLRRGHITVHTCGTSGQESGAFIHDVTARCSSLCSSRPSPLFDIFYFLSVSFSLPFAALCSLLIMSIGVWVEQSRITVVERWDCGVVRCLLGSTRLFSTRRFLEFWIAFQQPAASRLHSSCSSLESLWRFPGTVVCVGIRFCRLIAARISRSGFTIAVQVPSTITRPRSLRDLNPTWHLHFRVTGHETSLNSGGQSWCFASLTGKMCDHRVPGLTRGDGGAALSTVSQTGSRGTS